MKYLNGESQFTRVSDVHAQQIMETLGYDVAESPEESTDSVASHVYMYDGERFTLSEEVIEGEDENLYVRLHYIEEGMLTQVDENGQENIIESVNFDGDEYVLESVYFDEDDIPYVRLVSEGAEGDDEAAFEETENATEE